MLVERVVSLHLGNERSCSNIVPTVINHGHLVLEVTVVAFEGFSWLHLHGEKMVVDPLELLSQGILVEEGFADLLRASERPRREGIKSV